MRSLIFPSFAALRRRCRLAALLGPGLLSVASYAYSQTSTNLPPPAALRAQPPAELPRVLPPVGTYHPTQLPAPTPAPAPTEIPTAKLGFAPAEVSKQVPINLDTVLRLADSQNWQTTIAREKLKEAFANADLAAKAWLPDLWAGAGWYRHEGGIANEDGTLTVSSFGSMFAGAEISGRFDIREAVFKKVDACRRVWQQSAEVSKLSHEALLDAASTYVDLLAARAAEAVALNMQQNLEDLLKQAKSLAKTLPAAEIDVARVQTELHGQQQLVRKYREGSIAAGAKLIYLLGLDPSSELAIMDRNLVAFDLVNATAPGEDLVAQAEQNGPAIRELASLLQLISEATEKANGFSQFMPVVDLRVAEGGFGTGPHDNMLWDNRLDIGVQVRWNLTEWATRHERQRMNDARTSQASAAYQDVRAKLIMGVQESREAVLSGHDQMDLGAQQLKHANDTYERSKFRLKEAPNVKDRSPSEVLLAIRTLNVSNLTYLQAIRDYDKAQLRLAILTGALGTRCE